ALAVRDRAFAELPYWAEWFSRPARPETEDKFRDQQNANELQALIRVANALSSELNRPEADRSDASTLAGNAADLKRNLEELANDHQRHCQNLLDPQRKDAA